MKAPSLALAALFCIISSAAFAGDAPSANDTLGPPGITIGEALVAARAKLVKHGWAPMRMHVTDGYVEAEPRCDDFLAKLSDRPESVEFLECTQDNDLQGRPFIARYRVKGSDALEAERYMSRSFGLPQLQNICCAWDSTRYFYRERKTHLGYELRMASEETLVHDRDSWPEIKFFYINVSFFTEDP